MNYSSFAKNYYRLAIDALDKYESYFGTIVSTNEMLDIDNKNKVQKKHNFDLLPNYDLNISASDTEFEKFLEYYGTLYPDVTVFINKDKLRELYSSMLKEGIPEDKQFDYIKLIVDVFIEDLVDRKVLV